MQTKTKIGWCILALSLASLSSLSAGEIIPFRSPGWKYVLGTQEPSPSNVSLWRTNDPTAFSDASWAPAGSTASAPVGYPSGGAVGLEATIQTILPTSAVGVYTNVYSRKSFVVTNLAEIVGLTLDVQYDDGYVVWLNGREVGRAGVNDPLTIFSTAADHEVDVSQGLHSPSPSMLVSGTNILAIQSVNSGGTSSDLFMDVRLSSTLDDSPTLLSVDPPPGAIVTSLDVINVVFSEPVSGVNASDLLINGNALVTSVVANNPRDYSFLFSQPPTGTVSIAWAPNPGIADTDGNPNSFVPGPGWNYTLNPNAISEPAVISEFMADNEHGIEDEDGTRSDWIEIYNPGLIDINLGGWFLTDTRTNASPSSITNLTKWRFPNINLAPNRYLLVWASQKNRTNPSAPLHTNFRLSNNSGSYLALVNPQTNVVSAFDPYPTQVADNSYGRDRIDPNLVGYFTTPTPGAQNTTSGAGYADSPTLSLESGVYTNNSLTLVMTNPPGTTIRYTVNGSLPTNGSPVYTAPIVFTTNMSIKARAFPVSGSSWPSPVVARTFIMLDSTTRDFNSNLPILVISTEGKVIPQGIAPGGARPFGSLLVVDTFRGRASLRDKPDFQGLAQFEVFGQTSAGFAKQPFNIEINDELGNDDAHSLLGMPAEADWKLRNPYADKCLMNDFLAYELFEQMGHYSCRRRFVEVFVDTGGGKLTYPGDYYGVLVLLEKIEQDKNRVNIAELTPAITQEPDISGGYMFKRDKASPGADLDFTTPAGTPFKIHEPKPREITTNQLAWLKKYMGLYETAVNAADWTTRTGTNHYSYYIDVDSFVDSHWIVEFPKQIDGYRISNFFSKDRNGKIMNSPIWDWNLSFGNANYLDGGHTNGWYYTQAGAGDHVWLRRLVGASPLPASGGDPDFIQKIIDRWGVLRTNILNGERLVARIDEIANLLTEAAGRNFAKYVYLDAYQWPNPDGLRNGDASVPTTTTQQRNWDVDYQQPTYAGIISEMKKWTWGRYLWVDSQFPLAPTLGLPGGNIAAGSVLAISAPAGTIYYTLDGTDPRQSQANGAIAPGALTYSAPITLNANARVFARARNGAVWSPPTIATYVVQTPRLVVTEIMYHPLPPPTVPATTNTDEDFEYIELKNVGPSVLNLNGYSISGGVDFTFPNMNLAIGGRVLVVKNQAAFTSRYGTSGLTIAGQYTGNLANEGNRIVLWGRLREPILDFSYDDEWYPITDGFGFSLVVVDENAPATAWDTKAQWRPSGVLNGTPGQADGAAPSFPQVVINEALTHSDPPPPSDTIELRNLSGSTANIGGWYLTDDFREPKKYRIPDPTTIAPGGYVTFDEGNFNTPTNAPTSFGLSSTGDEVYLFSADAAGNLTGYHHGFQFGAQRTGVTFGRHVTSLGEEHFVALSSPSLGTANSSLLIGPIVISEVMYHPPDVLANGAYWNNPEDEFVELRNVSGGSVGLFDPARNTNTWKLDKAVEYSFPPSTTIPAGGVVLVVNFDPVLNPAQSNAFRIKYSVPAGTRMFGPYKGDLSNEDENVALYRPDNPTLDGEVPYVLVDNVRYSDTTPWPNAADGYGQSLQRIDTAAYGDDVVNWVAGGPTPGSGFVTGTPPTITSNPANQAVLATTTATFAGSASGPGPLRYQWLFNGSPLGGATSSTLVIPNVQLVNAGQYRLMVLNPFGSAISTPATLAVLVPPNITQHPQNQKVGEGANAVFSVVATTLNPPLRYQWFRDGIPVNGATNSTHTILNAGDADDFTVWYAALTDASGTIQTTSATLTVLIPPQMVEPVPPLTLTPVAGETITLGARLRGTRPFHLRWRRNLSGGVQLLEQSNLTVMTTFVTITNIATNQSGTYFLLVSNLAGGSVTATTAVRTNAYVTVLPDSNSNGIPDAWENTYFGSPTGANRNADSDQDGLTNWEEYTAGTDPTNALSYLKVEDIIPSAGATLSFLAVSNRTYSVLYKDGVNTANYTKLADVIGRTTNWTATVVDPAPSPNRYYRLATPKL